MPNISTESKSAASPLMNAPTLSILHESTAFPTLGARSGTRLVGFILSMSDNRPSVVRREQLQKTTTTPEQDQLCIASAEDADVPAESVGM